MSSRLISGAAFGVAHTLPGLVAAAPAEKPPLTLLPALSACCSSSSSASPAVWACRSPLMCQAALSEDCASPDGTDKKEDPRNGARIFNYFDCKYHLFQSSVVRLYIPHALNYVSKPNHFVYTIVFIRQNGARLSGEVRSSFMRGESHLERLLLEHPFELL